MKTKITNTHRATPVEKAILDGFEGQELDNQDVSLKPHLPPETEEHLQEDTQSTSHGIPILQVIEALNLDEDDLTDEEIVAGIRQGMIDALAGNTIPAEEALAQLKRKLGL